MKKFQVALVGCALFSLLIACAPKPSDEIVDLSKARARLSLVDGSPISSDEYDDVNPILIRGPNEQLILVFESDRPCDEGCSGYNLFVAESVEAFDPLDPFYIPAFTDPQPLTFSSTPLNPPVSGRFNFQAALQQNNVVLLLDIDSFGIGITSLPAPYSSGVLSAPPSPVMNTMHGTDRLVYADFRTSRMITRDTLGDLYISRYNDMTDPGVPVYNDELAITAGATGVVPGISGFTDALLYEYDGYLAYGTHDFVGDYMSAVNDALDREEMELSYVSSMKQYLYFADLMVFSGGFYGDQHDLYVVTSHTLDQLWYQSAEYGNDFTYTDLFNIYLTNPVVSGNLGGIDGADTICNTDSLQPDINVYYKAMLVDTAGNRTACTTPNCGSAGSDENVDWVFSAGATYIRTGDGTNPAYADGVPIDTADANNLLGFSSPASILPLTAWTGFDAAADWTTDAAQTCSDWGNTGGNGTVGNANATGTAGIYGGSPACTAPTHRLYCVEQP